MSVCPALKPTRRSAAEQHLWALCLHSRSSAGAAHRSAELGILHLPLGFSPAGSWARVDHPAAACSTAMRTSSREEKLLLPSRSDLFLCFIGLPAKEPYRELATICSLLQSSQSREVSLAKGLQHCREKEESFWRESGAQCCFLRVKGESAGWCCKKPALPVLPVRCRACLSHPALGQEGMDFASQAELVIPASC